MVPKTERPCRTRRGAGEMDAGLICGGDGTAVIVPNLTGQYS